MIITIMILVHQSMHDHSELTGIHDSCVIHILICFATDLAERAFNIHFITTNEKMLRDCKHVDPDSKSYTVDFDYRVFEDRYAPNYFLNA